MKNNYIYLFCFLVLSVFFNTVHAQNKASGTVFTVPFSTMDSEDKEQCKSDFGQFILIDADGDGKNWSYVSNYKAMTSATWYKSDNDNYAILPGAIFANADCNYELSFDMSSAVIEGYSDIEVWIGTEPSVAGMKQKIGEFKDFSVSKRDQIVNQKIQFALPDGKAGTYYIAFREVTPKGKADAFSCYIRNISVKQMESSAAAPAQVSDANVTAGDKGALTATVNFTMPSTMMTGEPFKAGTMLTATLTSSVDSKTITAAVGTSQTLTVNTVQGDNELSLKVDGEKEGEPLALNIYTGVSTPKRVNGLKAEVSEDNMSIKLTWQKPTECERDGGYCDYDNLEYEIYLNGYESDNFVTNAGKTLTYTYTIPAGTRQNIYTLYVLGHNAAGTSKDVVNYTDNPNDTHLSAVIGTPFKLQADEQFNPDGSATYAPIRIYRDENYHGSWKIEDPSGWITDDNKMAIVGWSNYADYEDNIETMGRIDLPKFSTEGISNAAFKIKVMNSKKYSEKLYIYAETYGKTRTKIGEVDCSTSDEQTWNEVSFPLPSDFQNRKWINISIDATYSNSQSICIIDSYGLYYAAENDLAVTDVNGPAALCVAEKGVYNATVYNQGISSKDAEGHFEVKCDEKQIARSEDFSIKDIPVSSSAKFEWVYVPEVAMEKRDVEVSFVLTTVDDVAENNHAAMTTKVHSPEIPVVNDLSAVYSSDENGTVLTWSRPDATKPMMESFENIEPFYFGDDYASFKGVDGDKHEVFTFSGNPMKNEGVAKSWLTVDYTQLEKNDNLEAHSGKQYLMAVSPYTDDKTPAVAANDWLISPEVKSGSRMRFYVSIISENYPETFRVLASNEGNDTTSFTEIASYTTRKTGWQNYDFILPEGTRYFAINYVSKDKFGILIDDITYSPLTSVYDISGYNIYRNGVKIGNVTETRFIDSEGKQGDRYTVRTIADGEERINSNVAIVETSGINTTNNGQTCDTSYYNLQGVKMQGKLPAGIYVRMVNGKTQKIVVK